MNISYVVDIFKINFFKFLKFCFVYKLNNVDFDVCVFFRVFIFFWGLWIFVCFVCMFWFLIEVLMVFVIYNF